MRNLNQPQLDERLGRTFCQYLASFFRSEIASKQYLYYIHKRHIPEPYIRGLEREVGLLVRTRFNVVGNEARGCGW